MKKILVPAMLALLLFTAGCEKPPNTQPPESPAKPAQTDIESKPKAQPSPTPIEPEPEKNINPTENQPIKNEKSEQALNVKVYYPDDSGMRLVEVEREIIVDNSTDKYTAALEALKEEPDEENLTTIFPKNASIKKVTVQDGLATVDFDGSILKSFVGGSTGEEFLIASIVDTLTNFPEIKRVKFLVDGEEIETLSGHMDLSMPLERMDDLTE